MDAVALHRWRRRRPEELQVLGDAKRVCRRPEAAVHEWGCSQLSRCARQSWSPEEVTPLDCGPPPAHGPESSRGKPASKIPLNGGTSLAQPCPRCMAGESGHFNHTEDR
ncbi:uncharacterized protein C10orf143 homolog isoform 1-T3 [Trichechus inunguis]